MKTFFRKKCPECGKKSRLVYWQDQKKVYLTCPNCGYALSTSKSSIFSFDDKKEQLITSWKYELHAIKTEASYNSIPTEKPVLKNMLLKEAVDPKHLTDTDGKPLKLHAPFKESGMMKGGINKPPTTPKPKTTPKGQGKKK